MATHSLAAQGLHETTWHALSRHPAPSTHLLSLSVVTPNWLAQVQEGYNEDPKSL
jgi:hypothetical protein